MFFFTRHGSSPLICSERKESLRSLLTVWKELAAPVKGVFVICFCFENLPTSISRFLDENALPHSADGGVAVVKNNASTHMQFVRS